MIRRTALATAAAVAIVLAPTAALAYEADDYTATVSNPTPAAGAPVTVTVEGAPDTEVFLTVTSASDAVPDSAIEIAGSKTHHKPTNGAGVASFTVTLSGAGAYTATAKDAAGNVIKVQDLNVVAAAAGATSRSAERASGSGLAATGFDGAGLAAGAGALVVAGAGAVLVAKRRQSASV